MTVISPSIGNRLKKKKKCDSMMWGEVIKYLLTLDPLLQNFTV